MRQAFTKPYYILKGQNYYRYFAIILLTSLTLLSIYSIKLVGIISLPITFAAIFGLINIRFPRLILFEDRFIIEKRGLIRKLNDYNEFNLSDIKSISYSEGFTNWIQLIIQTLLGQAGHGGFSESDRMIIVYSNDTKRIYNRFGSRVNFKKAIIEINKKSPATNTLEIKHGSFASS